MPVYTADSRSPMLYDSITGKPIGYTGNDGKQYDLTGVLLGTNTNVPLMSLDPTAGLLLGGAAPNSEQRAAVRAGIDIDPATTQWKLRNFYKALYLNLSVSGLTVTRPNNTVRVGVFGDSVGNSKPIYVLNQLKQALGFAGGFFDNATLSGGATAIVDVDDGTYWINGVHRVVPSGGEILFQYGGGRPSLTKLMLFYIKEPDAGTFKIQTSINGGAYTDEAGYTSVDANDATTGVGVITITKTVNARDMKVIGLTGTVRVLFASFEDNTNGGIASYQFDAGGIPLSTANETPDTIKAAVFNAIGLDSAFMEFKDGTSFPEDFASFMNFWEASVTKPMDWLLIGTSPEQNPPSNSNAVAHNLVMRQYADANGMFYFDGYAPLQSWAAANAEGWGGDGTHLPAAANAFVANQLYRELGFNVIFATPIAGPFRTTQYLNVDGNGRINFTRSGVATGDIRLASDVELRADRGWIFKDSAGAATAFFKCNGSTPHTVTALAFGVPFAANLPTITQGTGAPEGVRTAAPGSLYMRTDGGVGESLYSKESGTGNTGWVAK